MEQTSGMHYTARGLKLWNFNSKSSLCKQECRRYLSSIIALMTCEEVVSDHLKQRGISVAVNSSALFRDARIIGEWINKHNRRVVQVRELTNGLLSPCEF